MIKLICPHSLFKCSKCKIQYYDYWFLSDNENDLICPNCFAKNTRLKALSKPSVVSEFELAKAISEYYVKEGIPKAAEKCCFVAKIVHNLITKGEPR